MRATGGASPLDCEEALGVDAWEVRRCLVHWLEDASLLPRLPAPQTEPSLPMGVHETRGVGSPPSRAGVA